MQIPFILFKHIAKAYLNHVGGGVGGEIAFGIAEDVMKHWRVDKDEKGRKGELEKIAQASIEEIKKAAKEAVALVAAESTAAHQEALAGYLMQVPGLIRRTLQHATDPSGRTVPPGFALKDARDLAAFLPSRLPRFRPGDFPLTNVSRKLVELLGIGGFGEVWKAINPDLPGMAPVALKFCIDPTAKDRLLRHEVMLLNRITQVGSQPGIVQLCNTYLKADPPCLEYEYVAGGELTGLIREFHSRGGIPPRNAAKIIVRLARTVGYFHRLQPPIVHRDLKPANILVEIDTSGKLKTLKIADFGIGGIAAGREIERSQTHVSRGEVFCSISNGSYTPLYASPEQIRGAAPDPRDDVHALGVIWFQLLSGHLLHGAPTGLDWIDDLKARNLSNDQIALLASCFSSNLSKRPPDAGVLAAKIAALFLRTDHHDKDPHILFLKGRGAKARGYESKQGFVVQAGSQARLTPTFTISPALVKVRAKLTEEGILLEQNSSLILAKDHIFNSPSSAAGVMMGCSANGLTAWKDQSGRTLKVIREERLKN